MTNTFDDRECNDVDAFHARFGQLRNFRPTHLTRRKLAERYNFMLEELLEGAAGAGLCLCKDRDGDPVFLADGGLDQVMEMQADALVDLVYVAKGTAAMMGLPWRALWDDVQRANMSKVKGETHRKMGCGADIAKPPGRLPPETGAILRAAGYVRTDFPSRRRCLSRSRS